MTIATQMFTRAIHVHRQAGTGTYSFAATDDRPFAEVITCDDHRQFDEDLAQLRVIEQLRFD